LKRNAEPVVDPTVTHLAPYVVEGVRQTRWMTVGWNESRG